MIIPDHILASGWRCNSEDEMKFQNFNNSAVGAGIYVVSQWPASGFRFAFGYPVEGWDVVCEARQGGIIAEGKKVNGFLKLTAPSLRRRYWFARCGVARRQTGCALQLRRGMAESGVRLPCLVSKGADMDSRGAVPKAGCHKNPRPNGRYFKGCCKLAVVQTRRLKIRNILSRKM